jgi:hypothetical protein
MTMTRYTLAATLLATGISAAAHATTWTMTFTNVAPNQIVGVNFNASRSNTDGPVTSFSSVYAGKMNWNGPYGKTYTTYCTQLTENINFNQTVNYTQSALANVPDPNPGPMGSLKATLVQDLYHRNYAAVVGSNNAQLHAAFQLAIWEITHENLNAADAAGALAQLNLGTGAMQMNTVANAGVFNLAMAMLGDLGDGGFFAFNGLLGLTHASSQDQLVVVPIPAAALLAGVGLLGVAAVRRRMK